MHLLHFRKGDKGAAMDPELKHLYALMVRAYEHGDHAAVLILEGRINAWTRVLIARANARDLQDQ
jgi:hypothetical protein